MFDSSTQFSVHTATVIVSYCFSVKRNKPNGSISCSQYYDWADHVV